MLGFFRRLTGRGRSQVRPPQSRTAFRLEQLEDRCVPSASNLTLPVLNSNPTAPASLYLDFTGLPTQSWGAYQNVTTPVFHLDGAGPQFTAHEVAVATEVWQRVSEIYSPFNINVTTAQPADLSHGKTLIVAIGGSYNDWFHTAAGGISYVGAFANPSEPNVSHVFVDGTAGVAQDIAIAAAHEAGHAFGLNHQSTFNASGQLTQEYNPGDSTSAPIMGLAYYAARALWWVGPADANGVQSVQNDEAVIAGAANGFGYRPDPFGQGLSTATQLSTLNGQVDASGVIDTPSSADYFTFTTAGGAASFTVSTAAVGPTLHARLELWSASGLIAVGDSPTALGASISTTLAAGRYYLVVHSHGGPGDVGQYALSANAPAGAATVFSVTADHALWAENVATQIWTLLSPAGTILEIGASKDVSGRDEVFALASDHSLWVHQTAGWSLLSPAGTILDLSASTADTVFALASDHSLWTHGPNGWAILSPAGTINGLSASPGNVVFALASDRSLWSHSLTGWVMLSPAGTIVSLTNDNSSAAQPQATVVASDNSLWQFDVNVWRMLAPAGSIAPASPVTVSASVAAPPADSNSASKQSAASVASTPPNQNKAGQTGIATADGQGRSGDAVNSDAAPKEVFPAKPYQPLCMCPACIAARKAMTGQ